MDEKPTYEELEYRVRLLERETRWREEAQRALKERETYLQILFEYAPDIYILCDARGRLIDANRTAEKVTGYRRNEVIGKDLLEAGIINGDQFENALNVLARVASRHQTEPEEFTIQKKNGSTMAAELRAYPVQMHDEPVVLMIARDITRYRDDIEALKREEKMLRALFEFDPEAVLVVDAETGRISELNPAARRLFGYAPGEMEQMGIDDLCAPTGDGPSLLDTLAAVKAGASPLAFRRLRTKEGAPLPALLSVSRFSAGGLALMAIRIRL